MQLRSMPVLKTLKGKRVFLRVDWNVPTSSWAEEDLVKIERTVRTIQSLAEAGARVVIAMHLGRPKGADPKWSAKQLLTRIGVQFQLRPTFLSEDLITAKGFQSAKKAIDASAEGSIFLLENVRFYPGEEKNSPPLAKRFAELADIYVNDAFADSHRAHASISAITKLLPSYAGPEMIQEVDALDKLLKKPARPFLVFIGGAKISTKIDLIQTFLEKADRVFIGGAMAHAFWVAKGLSIGKSFVEEGGVTLAKKLLKHPKLVLPIDTLVVKKIDAQQHPHAATIEEIKKTDMIVDIGPETIRAWSAEITKAKTIVWNGPVGMVEFPRFTHGSLALGRAIAAVSRRKAFGVVGGGDTIPVALRTGMSEWFDHISMGGGAMLEFFVKEGKLPGIVPLMKKSSLNK